MDANSEEEGGAEGGGGTSGDDVGSVGAGSQLSIQPYKNLRRKPNSVRYARGHHKRGSKAGRAVAAAGDAETGGAGGTAKRREEQRAMLAEPLKVKKTLFFLRMQFYLFFRISFLKKNVFLMRLFSQIKK